MHISKRIFQNIKIANYQTFSKLAVKQLPPQFTCKPLRTRLFLLRVDLFIRSKYKRTCMLKKDSDRKQ